jgi:predicted DNA-binding transcriptional regulator AlpA
MKLSNATNGMEALIPNLTGMADDLLTSKQVAALLGMTDRSLERWRTAGDGPRFIRLSRRTIRYRRADIDAFLAARVYDSTARY